MSIDDRAADPLWPRASSWLRAGPGLRAVDLSILGIPASRTSLAPTNAQSTPPAVRAALAHYSTWSSVHEADIEVLAPLDAGDVPHPDQDESETEAEVADLAGRSRLVVAIGGDGSITHSVARGMFGDQLHKGGLVMLDAFHDVRDGKNNESSVRRLIEAGMAPNHIVQIGITDWVNSRVYAERARTWGIRVTPRPEVASRGITPCLRDGLDLASRGGGGVLVSLDFGVCDRAVAPACPSSVPGGLSAFEMREAAFVAAQHQSVRAVDLVEVDATADGPDGRTVRLAAMTVLEAAAGLARRLR